MPAPLIRGKFVILREMRDSDAPAVVALRNQPEVARWIADYEPLTVARHAAWFRAAQARRDALFMLDTLDGTAFGTVSLYNFNPPRTITELGRLCKQKGLGSLEMMQEGLYLTHRFGFERLGLTRIVANISADNHSSLRLAEFEGYVHEGLRRRHFHAPEGFRDVAELGLLDADFASRRGAIEALFYGQERPEFHATADEYAARLCGSSAPSTSH